MTPKTKKLLIISGIVLAAIILLFIILKKKKSVTKQTQNNGNGNGSGSQASQTTPQQQAPQPQASQTSQPAPFDSQNAAFLVLNGAMPQTMADAQTVLDSGQGSASPGQIAAAEVIIGQTQQGYSNLFQS